MTRTASGWAVIDDTGLNVRTVSPTKLATMVNWLCTSQRLLATRFTSHDEVVVVWNKLKGSAELTEVLITQIEYKEQPNEGVPDKTRRGGNRDS